MTRKIMPIIVSLVIFSILLSGCKLPASTAPEIPEEVGQTTPIVIVTDSPDIVAQTPVDEAPETVPEEETGEEETGEDLLPVATETLEPIVAVPTVTRPAEYTLQEGEFPFCIARRFDLDPQALLSLNNLGPDTLLEPGTTLQIPQTGTWPGEGRIRNPHPTTHTVLAGETIYSIACYYGDVSPEAIIAVNNLEEPYTLTAGQTLRIP